MPQAGEQIFKMGTPAGPVMSSRQLLEKTRVAQGIEPRHEVLSQSLDEGERNHHLL
jgi:hypothetical protein